MSEADVRYWAVVPAAGRGERMNSKIRKQYLPLHGKTVIEHTLTRLLSCELISGAVLAVAEDDSFWPHIRSESKKPVYEAVGGSERAISVLNALNVLAGHTSLEDWVLVHDAARPCIRRQDILTLIAKASGHPTGGLLAVRVRDTMKRSDNLGNVLKTVERRDLWHALTPQMFRLGELHEALGSVIERGLKMSDESAVMEFAGRQPLLVEGHSDNIKITHPQDLQLAEMTMAYLEKQGL